LARVITETVVKVGRNLGVGKEGQETWKREKKLEKK
jgi:hypothetical protein